MHVRNNLCSAMHHLGMNVTTDYTVSTCCVSESDDVLDSEHTMAYLTNDNGHHTISQIFHKEITNMRPDISPLD